MFVGFRRGIESFFRVSQVRNGFRNHPQHVSFFAVPGHQLTGAWIFFLLGPSAWEQIDRGCAGSKWAWAKIEPPGIGPQVLVLGFISQVPCWLPIFDPQVSFALGAG